MRRSISSSAFFQARRGPGTELSFYCTTGRCLIRLSVRDAILAMKDGIVKLPTAESDETLPGANVTAPAFTALCDALDHWRRGAAPPISVHDCARVVRLIDQAYERAG
jgi:hypothetical protein